MIKWNSLLVIRNIILECRTTMLLLQSVARMRFQLIGVEMAERNNETPGFYKFIEKKRKG